MARIFPASFIRYMPDLSALHGYKQVKDSDTLTITVTLRGKETTTTYKGKDTLFGAPDYSYYALSAEPTSYKALTVSNGTFSFGKATAIATAASGASVTLTTNGRHAYYTMKVAGLAEDIASNVSAVTLHTTDGNVYGLRHVGESGAARNWVSVLTVVCRVRPSTPSPII